MGVLKDKESILWQAQEKVSELAHKALVRESKGLACEDIYTQAYRILTYIRALNRDKGNLTTPEIERILACIVKVTNIKAFPTAPVILRPKPSISTQNGLQGPQGAAGPPGSDADIDEQSEIDDILIDIRTIDGVKTFVLVDNTYVAPAVTCSISEASLSGYDPDQNKVVEKGRLMSFTVNESITKGRDPVTSYTATPDDPGFDVPTINTNGDQSFALSQEAIDSTTTYQVSATDGTENDVHSDTLTFVYPFLYGSNDLQSGIDHYAVLTHLLQTKANKIVSFNDTNKYFHFGYPASYGNLSGIYDQNGFNVTNAFTKLTVTVNSAGLDNDWSVSYYVYVTNAKTTIPGYNYTFKF